MNKKYAINKRLAIVVFSIAFSSGILASVTVHGTLNGTTYVFCTGGCSFSRGFFGTTKACDTNNVCVNFSGIVQEGNLPRPGSESPDSA